MPALHSPASPPARTPARPPAADAAAPAERPSFAGTLRDRQPARPEADTAASRDAAAPAPDRAPGAVAFDETGEGPTPRTNGAADAQTTPPEAPAPTATSNSPVPGAVVGKVSPELPLPASAEASTVPTEAPGTAPAPGASAEPARVLPSGVSVRAGSVTPEMPANPTSPALTPPSAAVASVATTAPAAPVDTPPPEAPPAAPPRAEPARRNATPRARADRAGRPALRVEGDSSAPPPASGRALQVDQAVRLQQTTGQGPWLDLSPAASVSAMPGAPGDLADTLATSHRSEALPQLKPETFAGRVLRGLSAVVNQRGGVMTMRLNPPELGHLKVQMTITRGTVNVQFFAASAQTRALLERSMATLRAGLESHGLQVERISVHGQLSSSATAFREQQAEDQAQQHQQRQQHDAAGGESRGRRDQAAHTAPRRHTPEPFAVPAEQEPQT